MSVREGANVACVQFRAPIMQRMFGLNFMVG